MTKRTLSSLGALVKNKRGHRKLREVAKEIGIGPATLMRVEAGRIPDLSTFGRICNWLKLDPGSFLGFEPTNVQPARSISAHLRVDQTPQPETITALATMIAFAANAQAQAQAQAEAIEDGNI